MSKPRLHPLDQQTIDALPDLAAVDLVLPDMNGLLRGKRVAANSLEKVFSDGVCLPMSLIASDILGNTVEETGLGYDIGDEDRICRPIPGTLRPMPWAARPSAQALLTMEDGKGGPFAANPREILSRIVQRFADKGLTPVVAVELEFYLLDAELDAAGRPHTSVNPRTGRRNTSTQVYYLQDLEDYHGFIDAVASACEAQRIPADTAVAEYSPGQFEINLKHRADAVAACDDAVFLKRTIKAVADQQGLLGSFMAKPFVEQSGSGTHIHVSLLDRDGNNLFACSENEPCDALRHAVAGLQASVNDCMLLFAPHANSYRRFVLNAFVPLNECWGFNNRTVALRIPHSDPANTRIEHRIAGADANPYLVTAAVLAGILDGLENPRDPGPPIRGNAYEQTEIRQPHWRQAHASFLASDFIATHFGSDFRHYFGAQKCKEIATFYREVSDIEYQWYLRPL